MLNARLPHLQAWTEYFVQADIPVLRRTVRALLDMAPQIDTLNAKQVAELVLRDPLMTLRVLAHMAKHKSERQLTDIETIEATVVMMGVPPFFANFADMPVVEDQLQGHHAAHLGLMRVLTRAYRAAHYAQDWAVHRKDLDFGVIVIAALLHDLAEMLLWCFAPDLALEIEALQKRNPTMRSAAAQRQVLGIELNDLEQALMRAWHLPELLVRMMDDKHAEHPQVRNVVCAVNVARHCANGWDDPALPDDYRAVAALLNVTPDRARAMIVPRDANESAAPS